MSAPLLAGGGAVSLQSSSRDGLSPSFTAVVFKHVVREGFRPESQTPALLLGSHVDFSKVIVPAGGFDHPRAGLGRCGPTTG